MPATRQIEHFINGSLQKGKNSRSGNVFNPATGEIAAQVSLASADEVRGAIAAAEAAYPAWAATPPLKRARIMFNFKHLLDENADRLAEIITAEHGKVLSDAKGEVTRGIEVVEFACGIPHLLKGEYSENVGSGIDTYSILHAELRTGWLVDPHTATRLEASYLFRLTTNVDRSTDLANVLRVGLVCHFRERHPEQAVRYVLN